VQYAGLNRTFKPQFYAALDTLFVHRVCEQLGFENVIDELCADDVEIEVPLAVG
jgi:hypothetical protein